MEEKELLQLIASRTKKTSKDYKRLEATLYPRKKLYSKPKKRKIKRKKDVKEIR